jgi:hypothetical protein
VATLRLLRHIQRLVAKHVVWHINAALAPAKAASASASYTSLPRPRGKEAHRS